MCSAIKACRTIRNNISKQSEHQRTYQTIGRCVRLFLTDVLREGCKRTQTACMYRHFHTRPTLYRTRATSEHSSPQCPLRPLWSPLLSSPLSPHSLLTPNFPAFSPFFLTSLLFICICLTLSLVLCFRRFS